MAAHRAPQSISPSSPVANPALTPRLLRQMERIAAEEVPKGASADLLKGMLLGLRLGMKAMYPDAESFVGQDPQATKLVLTYMAIEEAANGNHGTGPEDTR